MRQRLAAALLIPLLGVAACSTLPDPPPYPDIRVVPIEDMAWIGASAEYTVRAPLGIVRRIFKNVKAPADPYRIIQITPIATSKYDALVTVRIREPGLGFEGTATCQITAEERMSMVWIRYSMIESEISLWRLEGEVSLVKSSENPDWTDVRQEFRAKVLSYEKGAFEKAMQGFRNLKAVDQVIARQRR